MRCATRSGPAWLALLGLQQRCTRGSIQAATAARTIAPAAAAGRRGRCCPVAAAPRRSTWSSTAASRGAVQAKAGAEEPAPGPDCRRPSEEQASGQQAAASSDAASLQLRVGDLEGQVSELQGQVSEVQGQVSELLAWRRSLQEQGPQPPPEDCGTHPPDPSQQQQQRMLDGGRDGRSTSTEQEPAAEAAATEPEPEPEPEPEVEPEVECAFRGPYPDVHMPRTRPVPGAVVTADNAHVGLVVRRGPDWDRIHTNWIAAGQDGGPSSDGIITSVSTCGEFAHVTWRATGVSISCFITGERRWRELVVAPAQVQIAKHKLEQRQAELQAQRHWRWWPW
ncbi:hypothetical protein CHLRE_17g705836v5 [Chlamydomonas reinhardtii]|uniref:Uncharacterized protein n=1 Tax=Chlamydomonas reinhardtii TaxID=3055 RepID=A0A2K3CPB7_CHLRE|nr:uncharacterized protein CHLRE_17g705836v5 [Chlamydomonas reinhardtii]PNW70103.1 hypothetical protein CHLRE_17g705836v5 [Chlamydomonas reinhardtii]